ncbi:MAG: CHAD domain-containing protein [Rhodoferax sp.]|nr:CHAD domain-containing protein [Rhodoferax sp.]
MHSGVIPFHGPVTQAPQPDWQGQLGQWSRLVGRCSRKPGRRRVHGLRVATLRLETELEVWLRGRPDRDRADHATRRWMREAERLRKVLSPVRDADVFLQTLAGFGSSCPGATVAMAPEGRDCLRGIARLKRRLERRRTAAGRKLLLALAARGERMERAGRELAQALAEPETVAAPDWAAALRTLTEELAAKAPHLTVATLHDFRKQAKAGRYLAEIAAPRDPLAKRQAEECKDIQTVAGAWHDWQALAEEAARSGVPDALVGLLVSMAERSLAETFVVCRRAARALSREGLAASTPVRPVQSAVPETEGQRFA